MYEQLVFFFWGGGFLCFVSLAIPALLWSHVIKLYRLHDCYCKFFLCLLFVLKYLSSYLCFSETYITPLFQWKSCDVSPKEPLFVDFPVENSFLYNKAGTGRPIPKFRNDRNYPNNIWKYQNGVRIYRYYSLCLSKFALHNKIFNN